MRNVVLVLLLAAACASAGQLWYNGDYDGREGICSAVGNNSCQLYDDFIVSGGGWTVNSVYTTAYLNQSFTGPTSAGWEIRSGVSEGNGGTVVASGTTTDFTWTSLGTDPTFGWQMFDFRINGLNATLGDGTYWLTLYPIATSGWGWIAATSGANSIGLPGGNDGLSYINAPGLGANFLAVSTYEGGGTWDFAMGIDGTANEGSVPEPVSLLLAGAGLAALLLRRRLA